MLLKLFKWEYWSFHILYAPIYPYWIWLAIKSRSFFFFNAANPQITNGGFLMDSKKEIYKLIPNKYYPETVFFNEGASFKEVLAELGNSNLRFPLVAKPDLGANGRMVTTINNEQQLQKYVASVREPFLVQEWVQWEKEVGLFYVRFPDTTNGFISGIVEKIPLTVTGDGVSTLEELIKAKPRAALQWKFLRTEYKNELMNVLPTAQRKTLVSVGNHIRGSKFIDVSHFADEKLNDLFNEVCLQIPEFFFGRLDVRFSSWEELRKGKNFSVIEVNGSGSEPTHIYDSRHSIFFAWKEIIRHWNLLQKISMINHTKNGIPFLSIKEGMRMFKQHNSHLKKVKQTDK